MLSLIRNHWGKFAFAIASFFWTACTDDTQPMYGAVQPPSESSSSMDDCLECTYGISVAYPLSSSSTTESSSSAESSGAINCYTTSVKSTTGSSYDIFECDNGKRYLKDYQVYGEGLQENLPADVLWSKPDKSKGEGVNCDFNGPHLCVDKMDAEGHMYGGCMPTIECPYKKEN